jgi:hypothetical protein
MTKPTMTSQWDPGSYKPLDMSKIPGYPRQMPPISKRWFPKFTGGNGEVAEFHMREFYSYFALNRVDDDAEDVVMKLFSKTLHGDAKKWYDNLPDAGITSMDQFEEVFLEEWGIHSEDIPLLIKNFEDIKQRENETLFDFQSRFEGTLCRIPKSHYPEMKYVVHRYTHAILPYLGVSLRKRAPRTLNDAYGMAKEIKNNIFSSGMNDLFTSGTLTMESLYSHEDLVQHEMSEDIDEEQESENDDEVSTCAPLADEALQDPVTPAQDEENEVSYFDSFDDALFYDSENEEGMEPLDEPDSLYLKTEDVEEDLSSDDDIQILEALAQEGLSEVHCSPFQVLDGSLPYDMQSEKVLDVLTPPCYDTDTDIADFDEFIHVGRRGWDTIGYDTDPIYDTKNHLQMLPLHLPQQISFDQWQQGDEVFTCRFQNIKDDPVPYLSDEFQSYLEMFDEYPAEHLDPTYKDDCQTLLCSSLNTSKDIVCLKEVTHDFSSQPPVSALPCFSIQGVVGKYLFRVEFSPGQTLDSKGRLGNTISNQFFNLLLMIRRTSAKLSSVLSLECEDVLGNQSTGPLSPSSEPCTFHDPFLDRIECFSQRWTWRDFVPPTRLHELDPDFSNDMIYFLTHDIFVLDLSLFWFMMKHKGRYQGALLDWLHWLFDYTNMQPAGKYR